MTTHTAHKLSSHLALQSLLALLEDEAAPFGRASVGLAIHRTRRDWVVRVDEEDVPLALGRGPTLQAAAAAAGVALYDRLSQLNAEDAHQEHEARTRANLRARMHRASCAFAPSPAQVSEAQPAKR